ncbi:MAG TPA: hypothetical protein VGC03_13465 [Acidimicrobiia bacterium]|jgi:hypothetical protein
MTRRVLSAVALALLLAACTGVSGETTTTTLAGQETTTTAVATTSTSEATTTTSTLPEPTWDELPGVESLPQEIQDELLALVRITEELRGLRFLEAPIISVVTEEELETRVRQQIEEESDDFPADEALYELLGLLDDGVDLASLLTDLYGEQVAGYYDGETGELVVPMRVEGFSVVQRATMVHELTHSLTDQQHDFHAVYTAMLDGDRLDEASAYQALIEGDASMVELLYLQSLTQRELGEFFAEALDIDTTALDAAPAFIQDSLIFPYDAGLAWVQHHYLQDLWETVDAAYSEMPDLPGSTEQIITPADYGRDLPQVVEIDPPSIPGYVLERESVWGEFGLRVMLDQALGEDVGVDAADGWGGDYYAQWFDGENAALLIIAQGDTDRDTEELRSAMLDFARTAVAEEYWVWVEVFEDRLAFIAAHETEVGESILASVGG